MVFCIQARILMVVDNNFYTSQPINKTAVDNYLNDIQTIDRKPAELILWVNRTGNVREQCFPLWQRLVAEYSAHHHNPRTEDDVEGAIFVGVLPIPMFRHIVSEIRNPSGTVVDSVFADYPHDVYFMDIWNTTTDQPYPIDTALWHFHTQKNIFFNTNIGYQSNDYKYANGDGNLDIWVSRIMGEFIHIPNGNVHGSWYPANQWVYYYLMMNDNYT
jgi:hypothetical protein